VQYTNSLNSRLGGTARPEDNHRNDNSDKDFQRTNADDTHIRITIIGYDEPPAAGGGFTRELQKYERS